MLDLSLEGRRHGFESALRMGADAAAFLGGLEFVRRGVVGHQEGIEFAPHGVA